MAYVDIVIIGLIALFTILGFFKGFFRSIASFMSFLISLVASVILCKVLANMLLGTDFVGDFVMGPKGSLYSIIHKNLPGELGDISNRHLLTAYGAGKAGGNGDAYIKEMFQSGGFGGFFLKICYPLFKDSFSNASYLSAGLGAREIVAMEMTYGIFVFFSGVMLFILFRIVAKIISMIARRNAEPSPLSVAGRFAGMIVGAAKGVAYCLVFLSLIAMMTNFSFMKNVNEQFDKSTLGEPLLSTSSTITRTALNLEVAKTPYAKMIVAKDVDNIPDSLKDYLGDDYKKLLEGACDGIIESFKALDWTVIFDDSIAVHLATTDWKDLDSVLSLYSASSIESDWGNPWGDLVTESDTE